jgi:hypothetical protein
MYFILSDSKCYGSTTSSSKNHLWSAKENEWWKNNKKNNFPTYKTFFILFFGPLLFPNLVTFLFLFILNNLKCYRSATYNSINHLWTLITRKQNIRNFVNVWEPAFVAFGGFFFEFLTPSTLKGHNFFNSIIFWRF